MHWITPLLIPNNSLIYIAPPAAGKTRMLLDIFPTDFKKVVFISPLRALINELFERLKGNYPILLLESGKNKKNTLYEFYKSKSSMILLTAEMVDDEMLAFLYKNQDSVLVVIDEFHLFYLWGDDFRHALIETLMGVFETSVPVLGLTATLNESLLNRIQNDISTSVQDLYIINHGNMQLKFPPAKINSYPNFKEIGHKMINRRLMYELKKQSKSKEIILVFCRYREEVDRWLMWCKKNGILAIGCKGGETTSFSKKLQEMSPAVIFATIALSHGVNLPPIRKIFITYKVEKKDFFIQMVGRGGRQGEKYELHSLNEFEFIKDSKHSMAVAIAFDVKIKLWQYFDEIKEIIYTS